jgi:hypothetical protein
MESEFGTVLNVFPDGTCNVEGEHHSLFERVEVWAAGYTASEGDQVIVIFISGRAVIVGSFNVAAAQVPTITVQDTTPSGTDLRQVTSWYQATSAGDLVPRLIGVRASPPPAPTTTKQTFVPAAAGTWDAVNGWAAGDVMQGQVSRFPYPRKGLWLYPDLTSAATVTGLQITVHRKDGSGADGNVPLRFYLHNYTAPPGGEPGLAEFYDGDSALTLSPDATNTFTLPVAWGALLAAGTRTGVGIYSTTFADYCRCDGPAASGVLSFTYAI